MREESAAKNAQLELMANIRRKEEQVYMTVRIPSLEKPFI